MRDLVSHLSKIVANFVMPDTDIPGKIEFLESISHFMKWIRMEGRDYRGTVIGNEKTMKAVCKVLSESPNVKILEISARDVVTVDSEWKRYLRFVEEADGGNGIYVLCVRGTSFLLNPIVGTDFKSNARAMNLKTLMLLGKVVINGKPKNVSPTMFVVAERDWSDDKSLDNGRFFLARMKETALETE